mgnify:CR=1 FL=1
MAKKKKTRKKARTANRLDYTKGGRVGYQPGGRVQEEPGKPLPRAVPPQQRGRKTPSAPTTTRPNTAPASVQTNNDFYDSEIGMSEEDIIEIAEEAAKAATIGTQGTQGTSGDSGGTSSQSEPTELEKAQQGAREGAQAIIDDAGKSATPQVVPTMLSDEEKAEGMLAAGTGQMTTPAPTITPEQASLEGIAPEQVTQITDVVQADAPQPITTELAQVTSVTPDVSIEAAQGQVSDNAIAQAAGVERVAPIEGADVEIQEGALAQRVVGSLTDDAKAKASVVAGSNLGKVTRAKKQLRRAGISESVIAELGNDPEALEAALMDLSEEERGVIEGLPEEALVSNQLDTLLKGIEEGEIPAWARPAVSAVENMLAARGLSASSVGRDALFNAVIQSAIPLAQSNAQAIQAAVVQERSLEAQRNIKDAELSQQAALVNANNVFKLNLAQFSADQQTALSNSKFLQTATLAEAQFDQQSVVQNAVLMSQANLAEANLNQRAQIQNAQAFLQMDMANLSNQQQAIILESQQEQQRLLSNQAAENAAAQFNASSVNQTNQFMAGLAADINKFNVQQMNATKEFNASALNAAEARRFNNEAEFERINTQLAQQAKEFNAQAQFERDQFNAKNALLVEQSNAEWRRQINLADTAAINEANRVNVQNQFQLTSQAQAFLWQELRDQADFDFRKTENDANRTSQLIGTVVAADPKRYTSEGRKSLSYWIAQITQASTG